MSDHNSCGQWLAHSCSTNDGNSKSINNVISDLVISELILDHAANFAADTEELNKNC